MHLFQGHRTSSEPLWHVGLPPLFTQAYIHSLHRFLAHFIICDDYFMISSGFPFPHGEQPFQPEWEAAIKGRATEAKPPRFDIQELKPWEVMFADEKEFSTPQRGCQTPDCS